jgi:ATP-binding cassette, subfamily B, bacterial MsbA
MLLFLSKIWGLVKPYRTRLFLGVLAGLVAGILEPLVIAVFTGVFHLIFSPGNEPLSRHLNHAPQFINDAIPPVAWDWLESARQGLAGSARAHPAAVIALIAAIPAVILLRGLFSYLNIYFLQWSAIRAITDLRVRLFEHVMNLSAGFFNASNSAELMSRISMDTVNLQTIIVGATAVVVKDPATLVGLLVYLLWKQPKLTLISMVVMPLCVIPIVVYGRKVRRSAGSLQDHYAEMSNVMSEAFTGNRIVKAYNLEPTMVERFRETTWKLIGHSMRIVRAMEIPGPLLEVFGAVGVALVFLYLAFAGNRASYSDFLGFLLAIFSMYRPIKNLSRLQNNIVQARAASDRIFQLLDTTNTIPEPANPLPLSAVGKDIQFENIDFAFAEKQVLHGINLTVKAGQFMALVGPTGSGKTTLTNLLLRFYDPQQGAVRIGGVDIRKVSTRELRNQIAVVTQETALFNETIRRNIELGRLDASEAEIIAAAKHAHAHDFIMEKPLGYETVVGERGVAVSGGQRQRIAIARAILRNAPILILDEATNALDAEAERIVQSALEELMQGRTTFCIAHRLSTIQRADVIAVFDQGRIVELGRHAELLNRNGVYRRLYEMQFRTEPDGDQKGGDQAPLQAS